MAHRISPEKESQIVKLLKAGYSIAEVAVAVQVAENTVRSRRFRCGAELRGVDSRFRELLDDDLEIFHARERLAQRLKSKVA